MSDDTVIGGPGNDTLIGGDGNDSLFGGDGQDQLLGGTGNDTLDASGGDVSTQGLGDYVRPGLGSDLILGHQALFNAGQGVDLSYADITGLPGLLIVSGNNGSGTVTGAGGQVNDTFSFVHFFEGSQGNDTIIGSDENRFEGFAGLGGADSIVGGGGFNVLDYSFEAIYFNNIGSGITANLATGLITDTQGNVDTVSGIGELRGTNENDSMTAAGASIGVVLRGLAGNDTIIGSAGSDLIEGGSGDDSISPGDNVNFDQIDAGTGNDTINLGDVSTGFVDIRHTGLSGPITVTVNGNTNTGFVDKGSDGSTTLLNVADAIDAGSGSGSGGLSINGTAQDDVFNITGRDGGWISVKGDAGQDSYTFGAITSGTVRIGFNSALATNGVTINLATGTISDDGFGNIETITGAGNITEVLGSQRDDNITGSANDEVFLLLSGNDTLDAAQGTDKLRYDWLGFTNVNADLTAQTATGASVNGAFAHVISNVENLDGTTTGNDTLAGSAQDNILRGLGGNDTLDGQAGNDSLEGGSGNDSIIGGGGDDTLSGSSGADVLIGGDGNDVLLSGGGIDTIFGDDGDDLIFIETTADVVDGGLGFDRIRVQNDSGLNINLSNYVGIERLDAGEGNDTINASANNAVTILGGGGNDTVTGSNMSDQLFGNEGNDRLIGGNMQDFLFGGAGADTLVGGNGNDQIYVDSAGDVVDGGSGTDRVLIETDTGAILNLSGWSSVERIDGGDGGDQINASVFASSILIIANGGNDSLFGGEANDVIFGNSGNDRLTGNDGNDVLVGGSGVDTMNGGDGDDTFFLDGSADVVFGGTGLDRARFDNGVLGVNLDLVGWSGLDRLNATLGNDTIDASSQASELVLNGNTGDDSVIGGSMADFLFGGFGNDTLVGNNGNDSMWGNAGDDTFFGGAGDDLFFLSETGDRVEDGGAGFDRVFLTKAALSIAIDATWTGIERVDGVAGSETIDASGYASELTIVGNDGADSITGGFGSDVIFGNDGADRLNGGAGGNDFLYGGAADGYADLFVFEDGAGTDRVFEFEDGFDLIDVTAISGISSFGDLTITAAGSNTNVTAGAETVVLVGIDSTSITSDDFIGFI